MTENKLKEIHQKIISELKQDLPDSFAYHNAQHTEFVVQKAEMLAKKENIAGRDLELIRLAALYHDTGFLISLENHEDKGCVIAKRDLGGRLLNTTELEKVCGMIAATKIPQRPQNILEKIVADADLFYLGTEKYTEFSQKLFVELRNFDSSINEEKWLKIQVDFLSAHSYHTMYGKEVLAPVKLKNLKALVS